MHKTTRVKTEGICKDPDREIRKAVHLIRGWDNLNFDTRITQGGGLQLWFGDAKVCELDHLVKCDRYPISIWPAEWLKKD